MNWRPVIGVFMLTEIWTFLSLNILCLYCMKRGRLYANKDNPAYVITTFNLLSETCQLLCHVVYIGPAILAGDFFFEGGQASLGVTVVATWFLGFWYLGSFIQVLMAANRLCVVFFPGRKILTHGRLLVIAATLFFLALGAVIYSQLVSPCCRITPDPKYFAYSYLVFENQTENPSMKYVDLPIDTSTSVICACSYCAVGTSSAPIKTFQLFSYVYRMEKGEMGRKLKEIRICFQFLIMFLAYTVAWSTFFLLPMLNVTSPEPYMITAAAVVTNCGVNAVVYLTLNKEVKGELRKLLGKVSPSMVAESTRRSQVLTRDTSHQDNVQG